MYDPDVDHLIRAVQRGLYGPKIFDDILDAEFEGEIEDDGNLYFCVSKICLH